MQPTQSRPARLVPVLAKHEREIAELAHLAGSALILGTTTTATKATNPISKAGGNNKSPNKTHNSESHPSNG
jgi:hypothetical protein